MSVFYAFTLGSGGFLRAPRILAAVLFVTAITGGVFDPTLNAATVLTTSDQQAADAIWGSTQTWGQVPPPPAHKFNNPIPIGMGARPIGMGEAFSALSDELSGIW